MACVQYGDIEELYKKDNFDHLNTNFDKSKNYYIPTVRSEIKSHILNYFNSILIG